MRAIAADMTTLTDAQKAQVGAWLAAGQPLAEVQNRLARELGVSLTYMELKLLVSELKVMPKDREATAAPVNLGAAAAQATPAKPGPATGKAAPPPAAATPPGRKAPVTVSVDSLTRPGAMVSGGVTFSDGKRATWHVDELGRLSVAPTEPGYRPDPGDMQEFQAALEQELARAGF